VGAHLRLLRHPVLRLNPVRTDLLALSRAVLRLRSIRPHLLALGHAVLGLSAIAADLLPLGASLHPDLRGLALSALSMLRPLDRGETLRPLHLRRGHARRALHAGSGKSAAAATLHPRRGLGSLTAATMICGRGLTVLATAVRSGSGRDCDR